MNIQKNQRVMNKEKGSIGTVVKIEETGNFIVQWDNGARLFYLQKDQVSLIILMGMQCQSMKKGA